MAKLISGFKKHIHYDRDIEAAVLGACIMEPDAHQRLTLTPEHFYDGGHQIVCRIIKKMSQKGLEIDLLTLVRYCYNEEKIHQINSQNADYFICRLTNAVISDAHMTAHQDIVKKMFEYRQNLSAKIEHRERTKSVHYYIDYKVLKALLRRFHSSLLRLNIHKYGKTELGDGFKTFIVPNTYCVFLMHMYLPNAIFTIEDRPDSTKLTLAECKEYAESQSYKR